MANHEMGEAVAQAYQQLRASGSQGTAREVRSLVGGRMSAILPHLRELKATEAHNGTPLRDWREAPDVVALKDVERAITDELASLRASLSLVQAKLDEGPQLYHRLRIDEHLKRVGPGTAAAFQDTLRAVEAEAEAIEAEIVVLTEELDLIPEVRFPVRETAIQAAAETLRSEYREKAKQMYALKASEVELAQDMAAIITLWDAQFPPIDYANRESEMGRLTRSLGRLPVMFDVGAVRRQAGYERWNRFTFTGGFRDLWDQLREFLGMEKDRGLLTEEGRLALEAHQAAGKKEAAARAAVQADTVTRAKAWLGVA